MTFLDAFVGLIIAPMETTHLLLTEENPRFGFSMLAMLFVTVFVPVALHYHEHKRQLYQPEAIAGLVLVLLLSLIVFVLLERLLLLFIGVRVSVRTLLTAVCYCLAPLILTILFMYLMNYLASGSLSYLTFVLNGYAAKEDKFLALIPWIITFGIITAYLEFTFALRAMTGMFLSNAFIVALISAIPLYLSLIISVLMANLIYPGSMDAFLQILYDPSSILRV
jgi:hypothetical protein